MNDIDRMLHALADAEARVQTPERVEDAVMAAWDATHASHHVSIGSRTRAARVWMPIAAGLLLIAALGIYAVTAKRASLRQSHANAVAVSPGATPSAQPEAVGPARGSDTRAAAATPVPATEVASHAPRSRAARRGSSPVTDTTATVLLIGEPLMTGESIRVVRMRVPRSALSAFGVRPVAAARADNVDLDVVVGEDGVARAIRVGM